MESVWSNKRLDPVSSKRGTRPSDWVDSWCANLEMHALASVDRRRSRSWLCSCEIGEGERGKKEIRGVNQVCELLGTSADT